MSAAQNDVIYKMADPTVAIDRGEVIQIVLGMLISFLIKLSEYGITVVWCRDGTSLPDKADTKAERTALKVETQRQIDELRNDLLATHPLARTPEQMKKFKNKLAQSSHVTFDEMKYFHDFVELLGFPSLQADNEAEKLCANLAREGLVAGVWSTDTDNYPLGTPMMITGFEGLGPDKHPQIGVVYLPLILHGLGLTHDQFVDLCIMLGTDFNKNMPNKGEKRCWDLIQKYKSIDVMAAAEPKLPIVTLKHTRVRELFAAQPTGLTNESKELIFDDAKFRKYSRDVTTQYDISHQYNALVSAVNRLPAPRIVSFSKASEPPAAKPVKRRLEITRAVPIVRHPRMVVTRADLPLPVEA